MSVLMPLLDLPEVAPALERARAAVDAVLRHRSLRAVRAGSGGSGLGGSGAGGSGSAGSVGARLTAETTLRAAVASAALEGHRYEVDDVRAGTVTDPVLHGAIRVAAALTGLAPTWSRAPRQALARLHVLAARGCPGVDDDALGRPLDAPAVSVRLDQLVAVVTGASGVPALLRAAVVHGELLALRPFSGPAGVVARAAARLELIAAGFDPYGLIAPELGHLAREPEYVGCANAFSTGTADGVRSWLRHCATAAEIGATELSVLADAG